MALSQTPPHTPPSWRLRRLDTRAFGARPSLPYFASSLPQLFSMLTTHISGSVNWCLAEGKGNGIQRRPMGLMATAIDVKNVFLRFLFLSRFLRF